jgi:hypothetical protein
MLHCTGTVGNSRHGVGAINNLPVDISVGRTTGMQRRIMRKRMAHEKGATEGAFLAVTLKLEIPTALP